MKRFYLLLLLSTCMCVAHGQRHLTEDEWDEMPITKPVVLEFYANWCAPCRQQGPIISRLAQEFPEIDFYKVNIDREKDWFSYETQDGAIPMIQFFFLKDERNGRLSKSTINGFMSYYEMRDSCISILRRYNEIQRKNRILQKMSTNISDTIVDISGVKYHLALSGAVDMGTSVLWAAHNLGANHPEQSGGYYSWGEIKEKSDYGWEAYKYANYNRSTDNLTINKYSPDIDRYRYLQISDDAATQKWGGNWRMPDRGELNDLLWAAEWNVFVFRGVRGLLAYSAKTKNALFFPSVGCKTGEGLVEYGVSFNIWSLEYSNGIYAYSLVYEENNDKFSIASWDRSFGFSIRPVYDK